MNIRKNAIMIAAIVVLALVVRNQGYAQDEASGRSQLSESEKSSNGTYLIGAKVGINFNSFTQPGTTIGANIGGFFRYNVLDFLQAQGEVLYSLGGGGRHDFLRPFSGSIFGGYPIDGPINSARYLNRSVLIQSIEVPIMARLTMPELNGSLITPRLIVGCSYAYNFGAFEQRDVLYYFNDGTEILLSNREENVTSDYFKHNFSLLGGFAIDYTLDNGQVFTTEFRYQRGLTNLNEVNFGFPVTTDRLHSQTFSINILYSIF